MKSTLVFVAGFAAGWLSRGAVASSEGAAATLLAFVMDTTEQLRRRLAIERERFDDLVAEARAQVTARRAARATKSKPAEQPMDRAA
jgi:hypothetical protein